MGDSGTSIVSYQVEAFIAEVFPADGVVGVCRSALYVQVLTREREAHATCMISLAISLLLYSSCFSPALGFEDLPYPLRSGMMSV